MKKEDLLILKSFILRKVPDDFYNSANKIVMMDSLIGLANKAYRGFKLKKKEVQSVDLNIEDKREISLFLSKSSENLFYYYLLKLVITILYHYSEE